MVEIDRRIIWMPVKESAEERRDVDEGIVQDRW